MPTTVLDALKNASINFDNAKKSGAESNPFFIIAMEQFTNAMEAIDNERGLDFVIQDEMGGDIKS